MKRWFYKDHFFPRDIEKVPAWQSGGPGYKDVHRFLCWNSYLKKHSPTRRYCEWTYGQIAEHVGLSKRQVGTIMRRLMADRLIYRWYAGDSGSTTPDGKPRPPRYEIPASRGMINWWRRGRELIKKVYHHRKEVKKTNERTNQGRARRQANPGRHQPGHFYPGRSDPGLG